MGVLLLTPDAAPLASTPEDRPFVVVVSGQGPAERLVADSLGDAVLSLPRSQFLGTLIADVHGLKPTRVVILGGTDVVTAETEASVAAATSAPVTRIAGRDRYETSARAATSMFEAPVSEVLIATSDASLDAAKTIRPPAPDMPVLLVTRNRVPAVTARAVRRLQPERLTVVGGAGAVSDALVRQLQEQVEGQVRRAAAP